MADRIDGTIWQANAGKTVLEWGRREPVPGNCLKFSRIREVDAAFNISKIQICLPTLGTETYFKAGQYIEVKTGEYFVLNRGQEAYPHGNTAPNSHESSVFSLPKKHLPKFMPRQTLPPTGCWICRTQNPGNTLNFWKKTSPFGKTFWAPVCKT